MKAEKIIKILDAEVITGNDLMKLQINTACGADLMSDVMAYVKDHAMLLTGLINPQVIRTAEMMDIKMIAFVRGKKPTDIMKEIANSKDMILVCTKLPMFSACGRLYKNGVKGRCDT